MIKTAISLQASGFDIQTMIMLVSFIGVFYFLIMRPQILRQKREKKFQAELKKGVYVITTSGMHGKIVEVNNEKNTVTLETGAGKIKFERSSISMELTQKSK